MIGHCRAMQQVYTRIRKVAPADVTVLVLGESGTGKELVARAIHRQSGRHQAPLICVNCAAIPETLIESELFGHEKGAFTGATNSRTGLIEAADGGTLFLDEIGELPLDAQARLLRVLQEGEIRRVGAIETRHVDVRLIAATHRDLHRLSATGEFRLDLYYRLNVMEIDLPALRERGDDVLELAEHLLKGIARRHAREGMRLSQRARQEIHQYGWPGNVRELENALERGVILADRRIIAPEDLGLRAEHVLRSDTADGRPQEPLAHQPPPVTSAPRPQAEGASPARETAPPRPAPPLANPTPEEERPVPRGLLPAFRSRTSGPHQRNGASPSSRHQPQESVGTPSAAGYPAQEGTPWQRDVLRHHQHMPPSSRRTGRLTITSRPAGSPSALHQAGARPHHSPGRLRDINTQPPQDSAGSQPVSLDFSAESMPENTSQSLACESLR